MSKNDGGPAFPVIDGQTIHRIGADAIKGIDDAEERDAVYLNAVSVAATGMSLRDYFAGKAMVGLIGNFGSGDIVFDQNGLAQELAVLSYQAADAMIAERAK